MRLRETHESVWIVGHSLGGALALDAALRLDARGRRGGFAAHRCGARAVRCCRRASGSRWPALRSASRRRLSRPLPCRESPRMIRPSPSRDRFIPFCVYRSLFRLIREIAPAPPAWPVRSSRSPPRTMRWSIQQPPSAGWPPAGASESGARPARGQRHSALRRMGGVDRRDGGVHPGAPAWRVSASLKPEPEPPTYRSAKRGCACDRLSLAACARYPVWCVSRHGMCHTASYQGSRAHCLSGVGRRACARCAGNHVGRPGFGRGSAGPRRNPEELNAKVRTRSGRPSTHDEVLADWLRQDLAPLAGPELLWAT